MRRKGGLKGEGRGIRQSNEGVICLVGDDVGLKDRLIDPFGLEDCSADCAAEPPSGRW